jgi:integrase
LYISFKQAVREAGLRNDLTIHSARHGYATLLYYKTKDLRAVQKQLGHSSLNMTSLYADIMPEENGEIANKTLDN